MTAPEIVIAPQAGPKPFLGTEVVPSNKGRFYFKSMAPSMIYILGNGKPCIFVRGVFWTSNEMEAKEIQYEIERGNPYIKQMAEPEVVMTEQTPEDMLAVLREQIIAEYLATEAAATNPNRDMGNTPQVQVKAANSRDVAVAMAGGSGKAILSPQLQEMAAKLLKAKLEPAPAEVAPPAVKPMMELLPVVSTTVQTDDGAPRLTELLGQV